MSEVPDTTGSAPESTGIEEADRVLASLADLDDLPVDEHVARFERAHEGLRRALDSAGGDGNPASVAPRPHAQS